MRFPFATALFGERIAERPDAERARAYDVVLADLYVAVVDREGERIAEHKIRDTINTLVRMQP